MKNKIYGVLTLLALNAALIAMDLPQQSQPWWHSGKSGLCQLRRGIGCEFSKDLEPKIALAMLGNNQWWYCDFEKTAALFNRPKIGLSSDGKIMAVTFDMINTHIGFFDTTTGHMDIKNKVGPGSVSALCIKDQLAIGIRGTVEFLDSRINFQRMFRCLDNDSGQPINELDFNDKILMVKIPDKELAFYNIASREKIDMKFENFLNDAHMFSLTEEKLAVANGSKIQIYDLSTKKQLIRPYA